jgi:cation-transporting P-type ATPase E
VPAGFVVGSCALAAYGVAFYAEHRSLTESRTTATLVVATIALWVLVILARPVNWWRGLLAVLMVLSVVTIVAVPFFRSFFALSLPPAGVLGEAAVIAAVGIVLVEAGWRTSQFLAQRHLNQRGASTSAATPAAGAMTRPG